MRRVGVTLGDPAGIGPEICELALAQARSGDAVRYVLFGPENVAASIARRCECDVVAGPRFLGDRGAPSAESGKASLDALMSAIAAAQAGSLDAICTAPISKEALALAGSSDRGHTEILSRELGDGASAMAFFGERLRCALVTTHVPLKDAIDSLREERIVEVAMLLDTALRRYCGIDSPKLALAALNPHAGEAGLLGSEEQELLAPAVMDGRARGLDFHGPLPADSLFRMALDGSFDAVVSLYHDQALIPLKLLGFGESTNITLGLRTPRSSPDHGTAYDRVGTEGINPEGMVAALRWAVRMAAPDLASPRSRASLGQL
ncbi:MAG: 4-hydroxythreonine-4-phosphate dehydrogenase PdxA [Myxococcota bacterium]